MTAYDHKKVEPKWQKLWEEEGIYKTKDDSKDNCYLLVEFPYPSGDGLHIGHPRPYIGLDVVARKRRAEGKNVLFPMGWDSFGLPTENYAIKTGKHPKLVTKENTDRFRKQIKSLGISFDWSREINTSDPKYYKWTQWIFLRFFKKGLAYKKEMPINWCTKCLIGLSNEEVVEGKCERCGGVTEKKNREQWVLAITKYADRLLEQLKNLDYSEQIKIQQANWIGKSTGSSINFIIKDTNKYIEIFTTRADTIYGATYVVLSPEHTLLGELKSNIKNWDEVEDYIKEASKKTEIERTSEDKDKTGIELKGVYAINPANKKEIPIWVSDYVIVEYGTGAVMAVPAHDERDLSFAKKFGMHIVSVIENKDSDNGSAYIGEGRLINSDKFNGLYSEKVRKKITKYVGGEEKTNYKLRDWVFSRQRYWGEPIPIINCNICGYVPVPEEDLPVELPDVRDYKPNKEGDSPLVKINDWVNVKCPKCGGSGERETDVMPNWAGSSWYFLRYIDPNNDKEFANKKKLANFMPVDWYNGGMEHTTLHLLYSRFWNNFLYDEGLVPCPEPYKKRTSHGMILGDGGTKMSKSKGNVINPDDIVETYGADTFRIYEMFMGPFDQTISWDRESIVGSRRFIEGVYELIEKCDEFETDENIIKELNKTIKKVSCDIETMDFNTAVSSLMIFANTVKKGNISKKDAGTYIKLIAPFAPHISCELWNILGNKGSICAEDWPSYDEALIAEVEIEIPIQINGKVRDKIIIDKSEGEEGIKVKSLERDNIKKWVGDKKVKKFIYIKGKIINIVL